MSGEPEDTSQAEVAAAATRHASVGEAAEAIQALSSADLVRLRAVAGMYWRDRLRWGPRQWADPNDLLQDAVLLVLNGKRKWRRGITIVKHLARTMESLSSHLAKEWQTSRRSATAGLDEIVEEDGRPIDRELNTPSAAEDTAAAREEVARVEAWFDGDDLALAVLRCWAESMTASETREHLGIGSTEYDTILKRIRRTVIKQSKHT